MSDYFFIEALKKIIASAIDSSRQTAVITCLLLLTLPIIVFIQGRSRTLSAALSKELNAALLDASRNGHTETVKILIEKGASIHEKDNNGQTPRDVARSGPCRDLLSNEKELNWLRRRPFAHVLSSIEQRWWDAQVTGREAVRTLSVSEMAREIGKYI